MDKLKHTPGPWAVDYNGTIGHIKTLCNPEEHTKTVIKYRYNLCEEILTEEEIQANARLIAAAPEMLEALVDVYGLYLRHDICCDNENIKRIIEKATGLSIEEVLAE